MLQSYHQALKKVNEATDDLIVSMNVCITFIVLFVY